MQNQAVRPAAWRFADLLDIDHIQRLQDAFAEAHHVTAVITDPRGAPITRVSRRAPQGPRAGGEGARLSWSPAAATGRWSAAAAIAVEGTRLADWHIDPTPGMAPERFEKVRGFLEQAADLVSHQARMQVRLNEALAARRRAEDECRRLEQVLQRSTGAVAVGRLAGGIAHDFGNLLTAITAYAEQLADELDDPGDPDAPAVRILAAADRAGDLVQRLLEVARQRPARDGEINLVALVAEAVILLEQTLPATIRITQTVDGDVRCIAGDGSCLHAALLNRGINAGHAMRAGGGELVFTVREVELAAGPHVEVRVRDSGEGMDEETRRRIFDPFFTTREDAGTGLGLTQARACIQEHGGSIRVDSEPGQGTVFTILLPVSPGAPHRRRKAG